MDKQYFIELGFKTPEGPEIFGRFFAGENCKRAGAIFSKLQGNRNINERDVIFLTFVETSNGLPVDLDMIGCTLDQLGENCKIITTELFKIYSLLPDTLKHRR
jgi:hypothetical protein